MGRSTKATTDIQIAFCGSAGDGTIAAGDIFKQAMAAAGFNVIAFDVYPPEIRGFGKCIARADHFQTGLFPETAIRCPHFAR